MLKAPNPTRSAAGHHRRQPFIGALLRLAYQVARKRQLSALEEHGFTDLNQALLNVMVYPHPDGVRLTDLAERINMTKQATNYLVGQLETLGYVERRARNGSGRRLVFVTDRGWRVIDTQRAAVRQLETEWSAAVGRKRFDAFMDTLRDLTSLGSGLPPISAGLAHNRAVRDPK
jgi:DNA-binding MarR family transcriptional regulator